MTQFLIIFEYQIFKSILNKEISYKARFDQVSRSENWFLHRINLSKKLLIYVKIWEWLIKLNLLKKNGILKSEKMDSYYQEDNDRDLIWLGAY